MTSNLEARLSASAIRSSVSSFARDTNQEVSWHFTSNQIKIVRVRKCCKKLKVWDHADTAIVLKFHLRLSSCTSSFRLRSFLSSDLQSSKTQKINMETHVNVKVKLFQPKLPTKLPATHFSMFATQSWTSPGMVTCRKNGTYIRSNKRLRKTILLLKELHAHYLIQLHKQRILYVGLFSEHSWSLRPSDSSRNSLICLNKHERRGIHHSSVLLSPTQIDLEGQEISPCESKHAHGKIIASYFTAL